MLRALRITSFRAFRSFTVERLERVNLLVGQNNSGKTCLLDAAEILQSGGDPRIIWKNVQRRGELLGLEGDRAEEADISHLFHGHELFRVDQGVVGALFVLAGPGGVPSVSCEITRAPGQPRLHVLRDRSVMFLPPSALRIVSDRLGELQLPLAPDTDTLPADTVSALGKGAEIHPVHYLGTEALNGTQLGDLWDALLLTPEESNVVEALRLIEPTIERIALSRPSGRREVFFVKLAGSDQRLPLGSMGDGLKRLLALSMHLARSSGGCVLVDEIDTGLHYSIMVRMWRLVIETAKRLDLQVFATTHSLDCINALAELCEQAPELGKELLLHRIEKGEETPMTYTADELRVAAAQHMEVR